MAGRNLDGMRVLVDPLVDLWGRIKPRLTVKLLIVPPLGLFIYGWVWDFLTTYVAFAANLGLVEGNSGARLVQVHEVAWFAWEVFWPSLAIYVVRGLRVRVQRSRGRPENVDWKWALCLVCGTIAVIGLSNLATGLHNLRQLDLAWRARWG